MNETKPETLAARNARLLAIEVRRTLLATYYRKPSRPLAWSTADELPEVYTYRRTAYTSVRGLGQALVLAGVTVTRPEQFAEMVTAMGIEATLQTMQPTTIPAVDVKWDRYPSDYFPQKVSA